MIALSSHSMTKAREFPMVSISSGTSESCIWLEYGIWRPELLIPQRQFSISASLLIEALLPFGSELVERHFLRLSLNCPCG